MPPQRHIRAGRLTSHGASSSVSCRDRPLHAACNLLRTIKDGTHEMALLPHIGDVRRMVLHTMVPAVLVLVTLGYDSYVVDHFIDLPALMQKESPDLFQNDWFATK